MTQRPWIDSLEHHFADVNGTKLHYVSAGEGPTLLFIHGFPEFWFGWEAQLRALSDHYRVVAVDMRGYNLSGKSPDVAAYRSRVLVEDLQQFIAHLDAGPVFVVAHDWGGVIAWDHAARYPQQVRKLVIINAPHPCLMYRELKENAVQRKASEYVLVFRQERAEALLAENRYARLQRMFDTWGIGGREVSDATRDAYVEAWSQPGALTGSLNWYRATPLHAPGPDGAGVDGFEINGDNHRVDVPTLVIWGMRDTALLPGLLNGLDEYVSDLRIERIEEGTHWVHHEFPDRVNARLRAFLGD